jgi:predicted NUDIX family NTP pyrophosphohydrolase
MSVRQSCGILLYRRRDSRLEVLLAHPGGPFFARRDSGAWTIPKGQPDDEDDLLAVAEREFAEETGHRVGDVATAAARPVALGSVVLGSGKVVHGWAIEGDLDPALAHSNEFEIEWPRRSGQIERHPEVDRVAWFEPDEARRHINLAQAAFIDRLVQLLEDRAT